MIFSTSHPPLGSRSRAEGKSTTPILLPLFTFAHWRSGNISSSLCIPVPQSQSTSTIVGEVDASENPKTSDMDGGSKGRGDEDSIGEGAKISRKRSSMAASSSAEVVSRLFAVGREVSSSS